MKWRGTRVVVRRDIQGPQIFVRSRSSVCIVRPLRQSPRGNDTHRLPVVCNSTCWLNRFYPYPYITLNPLLYAPPVDSTLAEAPPMQNGYKNFSFLFRTRPGTSIPAEPGRCPGFHAPLGEKIFFGALKYEYTSVSRVLGWFFAE